MSDVTTGTLRATLLLLVVLGVVGVAVMLASERHWDGVWQFVPWATLVGIIIALTALLFHTTRETVWLARVLAVVVIVVAVLGVWQHFDENYTTAPLDARYSESWETMSVGSRLWEVTKGSVGHVSVPTAAALVPIGIALAAATIGIEESTPAATRARRAKRRPFYSG